jgi:hypothetical protein
MEATKTHLNGIIIVLYCEKDWEEVEDLIEVMDDALDSFQIKIQMAKF